MGSNQSSANTSADSSFSIDPSGNITRKSDAPDTQTKSRHQHKQPTTRNETDNHNRNNIASPATPIDEQQSFLLTQELSSEQKPAQKSSEEQHPMSLPEAELVVSQLKSKYKPDSREMAGKQHSVFDEVERNLVQCYAANKGQTMNCSNAYQKYRDYVASQRSQVLKNAPLVTTATLFMIVVCILCHLVAPISCYGAMSIDLGSEWMKVGLVAPSVQMDIVLNAASQRKTPMAIAFSNNERFIGDTALDVASKYPERTFTHFLDLVGKTIDHDSVKHYKRRFPFANITETSPLNAGTAAASAADADPSQAIGTLNSIVLNHPQGLEFTPLELIAMMLQHAHDQVVTRLNSNEPATDVVITVPPFFSEHERFVVAEAARMVGLNVLRLTSTNAAFALSYGIFRHKDYLSLTNEAEENNDISNRTSILFFDQGASQSSATLADYYLAEQFDETTGLSKNESLPTIRIRAQVFDRYFGGFDMQLKLRDYLIESFSKSTGISEQRIRERGKSSAKLLKEAGRVKKILSANTDHTVRVENVIDDKDLKQPITRQQFEELNGDYLSTKITGLLDQLFSLPSVNRNDPLESVIIVGGNTRTPKIQQTLLDYFKLDVLGKSINADEGAALAALYQAASLGRGFRVKKFVLVEYSEYSKPKDSSATTTTTTAAPESTDSSGSSTTTTTEKPRVDYLAASRKKLADLREQDHLRLQRLSLRNSLESLLSEAREKLNNSEDEKESAQNEEKLKQVTETYTWLEDGPIGETDNVTILSDKYQFIQDLVFPKPPPPPLFDPSTLDLSSMLNNETLNILSKLNNITNPFASSSSSSPEAQEGTGNNDTTTTSDEQPAAKPETTTAEPSSDQEKKSAGNDNKKRGPPPHNEL